MPNTSNRKNTSRRSASAGTPAASPPGTRSRVAEAARRTNNPDSRLRLVFVGASSPAALIAHELVAGMVHAPDGAPGHSPMK